MSNGQIVSYDWISDANIASGSFDFENVDINSMIMNARNLFMYLYLEWIKIWGEDVELNYWKIMNIITEMLLLIHLVERVEMTFNSYDHH